MQHFSGPILLETPEVPQGKILILMLVIAGAAFVGLLIVQQVRKRLQHTDEPVSSGFTLSDLRQLHKSGQMSDEEFERAKAKVIEAAKRAAERDKPVVGDMHVSGGGDEPD